MFKIYLISIFLFFVSFSSLVFADNKRFKLVNNKINFIDNLGFPENELKLDSFEPVLFPMWKVYISFDFEIYYYDYAVAEKVITNIDSAYNSIIEDLDYMFYYNPKRIKIYIYRNKAEYMRETRKESWTAGYTDIREGVIYTYEQKGLMTNVLVHELTHMIFDSYMGFPRDMKLNWLHEGLAVYESDRFFGKCLNLRYLKEQDKKGKLYSLQEAIDFHSALEKDTRMISLWYLQVASVVCYLFTFDRQGFKVFCESFKRYKNIDVALNFTYPWNFHNVKELDKAWKKWLYEQGDYVY